ncbi:MAG: aldehyde dehydrogenase family protein [Dongiaceae bacterium]
MAALQEFGKLSGHIYVGGEFQKSGGKLAFDVIDPATEDRVGQLADTTAEEVDRVVAIANKAQKAWRKANTLHRAELMHEVARRMKALKPVLGEMLTREMGKPFKESMDEVEWSITAVDYYAEIGRHENGRIVGPATDHQFHFVAKEPVGTVVIILPFNYPLVLLCWEAAAALAAGNAVIIKPSDLTSLTTLKFMEAFAALPAGLVQCVTGGAEPAQRLVNHPDTHMVCFTGGIKTGQAIATSCAGQFKRCLIESSGNDPLIVMPSAPMEFAVRGSAFAAFMNCGQICASSERLYVHKDVHDEFVEKLVEETKKIRIGNGLDKVELGPMAARRERDRYEALLKKAVAEGAQIAAGGDRPSQFNKGWFVNPTVLVGVTPDMTILQQESFGPVAPICKVDSFDQAIEYANKSIYGLGSTIFTMDLNEAMRAVDELEHGMVWVNAPLLDNDAGPFGGRKMSGMGRQLGSEGLDSFRHTKFAMIDPGCHSQDFWWFPYAEKEAFKGPRD